MSSAPFDSAAATPLQLGTGHRHNAFESWLDTVAERLAEFGWTSQSLLEFLPDDLIDRLRREVTTLHRTESLEPAGVGRGRAHQRDRSVRRDRIAWINGQTDVQAALCEVFEAIQDGLNRRLFLGLKRFESHYATYEPGDFYRCHVDSFRGRESRIISLVLYLNEGWEASDGGELRIFNPENTDEVCATILPDAGQLALFVSEDIPHEVLMAQRTRYSVACWFRRDAIQGLAI